MFILEILHCVVDLYRIFVGFLFKKTAIAKLFSLYSKQTRFLTQKYQVMYPDGAK